jgi:hypothetical protein
METTLVDRGSASDPHLEQLGVRQRVETLVAEMLARDRWPREFPILTKATLMQHFDEIVVDRRLRLDDLEEHLPPKR